MPDSLELIRQMLYGKGPNFSQYQAPVNTQRMLYGRGPDFLQYGQPQAPPPQAAASPQPEAPPEKKSGFVDTLAEGVWDSARNESADPMESPQDYVRRRVDQLLYGRSEDGQPKGKWGKAASLLETFLRGAALGDKYQSSKDKAHEKAVNEYKLMQENQKARISEERYAGLAQNAQLQQTRLFEQARMLKEHRDKELAQNAERIAITRKAEQDKAELGLMNTYLRTVDLSNKKEYQSALLKIQERNIDPEKLIMAAAIDPTFPPEQLVKMKKAFAETQMLRGLGQIRQSSSTSEQIFTGVDPVSRQMKTMRVPTQRSTVSGPPGAMEMFRQGFPGLYPESAPTVPPAVQKFQSNPVHDFVPQDPDAKPDTTQTRDTVRQFGTSLKVLPGGSVTLPNGQDLVLPMYKSGADADSAAAFSMVMTLSTSVPEAMLEEYISGRANKYFGLLAEKRAELQAEGLTAALPLIPDLPSQYLSLARDTNLSFLSQLFSMSGKQTNLTEQSLIKTYWPRLTNTPKDAAYNSLMLMGLSQVLRWKMRLVSQGVPEDILNNVRTQGILTKEALRYRDMLDRKEITTQEVLDAFSQPEKMFGEELQRQVTLRRGGMPSRPTVKNEQDKYAPGGDVVIKDRRRIAP